MTKRIRLLIILVLITKHLTAAENSLEDIADSEKATTPTVKEDTIETTEREAFEPITTTQSAFSRELQKEKSDKLPGLEKKIIYGSEEALSPAKNLANRESIRIILKDVLTNQEENKDAANNSTKYFLKLTDKPLQSLATLQNFNLTKKDGELQESTVNNSVEHESTRKPLKSLETSDKSNLAESELMRIVLKEVTTLSNKQEELEKSSTEPLIGVHPTPAATYKLNENLKKDDFNDTVVQNGANSAKDPKELEESFTDSLISGATKISNSLESFQTSNLTEIKSMQKSLTPEVANTLEKDESFQERSIESSTNVDAATSAEPKLNKKPSISFEEYAVKQMNFILDYLLTETQEFVANVLQATVNSVFPRDQLKRYAEDLNRILNPDSASDYSSEIIEDAKLSTQDEIYEEIGKKLNFLKSKPSKFLQQNLPQEWMHDYRNKKAELTIWLDKATDQMHQEFNCYVTEEEDPIKYQYFNETFDDISRATEIHHKLALLADLVKIVKNKKQITFMDLYMQT